MNRIFRITLLCFFIGKVFAQELDGVWIQVYEKYPEEIIEAIPSKSEMKIASTLSTDSITLENIDYKFESYPTGDSLYRHNYALLELRMKDSASPEPSADITKKLYYQKKGDHFTAKTEGNLWVLHPFNDSLEVKEYHCDTLKGLTVWERLSEPSSNSIIHKINRGLFAGTLWRIETDTGSPWNNTEFYFSQLDTSYVMYGEQNFRFTSATLSSVKNIANHAFLTISGLERPNSDLFRLTDIRDSIITAEFYDEESFVTKKPLRRIALFKKLDLPDSAKLYSIESEITGTWESKEIEIPYAYWYFDSLTNPTFTFTLRPDRSFEIKKTALLHGKYTVPMKERLTGRWELSKTGTFLSLKFKAAGTSYVNIISINPESVIFRMRIYDIKYYSSERHSSEMLVKLNRIDTR